MKGIMIMEKEVIIDGRKYREASTVGEATRLVLVDNRGLLFVGKTSLIQDDLGFITIHDARCVVYWGTTKHIAELCDGPTPKTKLGKQKTVRVQSTMAVYDCADGAWEL